MSFMIAVFKSRREAIEFGRNMQRRKVRVALVNTPSSVSSACGLSVRFGRNYLRTAESVLSGGDYFTFIGFYNV